MIFVCCTPKKSLLRPGQKFMCCCCCVVTIVSSGSSDTSSLPYAINHCKEEYNNKCKNSKNLENDVVVCVCRFMLSVFFIRIIKFWGYSVVNLWGFKEENNIIILYTYKSKPKYLDNKYIQHFPISPTTLSLQYFTTFLLVFNTVLFFNIVVHQTSTFTKL